MVEVVHARGHVHILAQLGHSLRVRIQVRRGILGEEIAAHLRIWVENAGIVRQRGVIGQAKRDRTVAVETDLVIGAQYGHRPQVIDGSTVEFLVDGIATRAIDVDLLWIVETHPSQLVVGDFIDATLGNRYFDPFARSEFGTGSVDRRIECIGIAHAQDGHQGRAC